MPGARCTRSRACISSKARALVTTSPPEHPAFPHAMVLTVYFVLSLVTRLCCHHRRRITSADLTPAIGRQDHTTSPSASALSSAAPLASIASRPYVRDDRETPLLYWAGMARDMQVIWVERESKCFFKEDWTGQISLIAQANFFSARTRREAIAALNASLERVILIRPSKTKRGIP